MITNKQKIRLDFAPLTVMCSAAVQSGVMTQQFEGADGTFAPDRRIEPLVIMPTVIANADDGSWENGTQNGRKVADGKWYVDGSPIGSKWTYSTDYLVNEDTSSAQYGQLTVKKNITEGTMVRLHFEADVADSRIGKNIHVVSNSIMLTTIAKSPAEFTCTLRRGSIIYDIFEDHLLEWDYAVANSKPTNVIAASRDEAQLTGTPFIQKVPVQVYRGDKEYRGAVNIEVYKRTSAGTYSKLTAGESEVIAVTPAVWNGTNKVSDAVITFDVRLCANSNEYRVYTKPTAMGNVNASHADFSIVRNYSDFNAHTINQSSIDKDTNVRYDQCRVVVNGKYLPYPEAQLEMTWFTSNYNDKVVEHNQGTNGVIDMIKAAPGDGEADGWLNVWLEINIRQQEGQFIDENGAVLLNENAETLIS